MFKIISHSKAWYLENFTDMMRPVLGQVFQETDDNSYVADLLGSALRNNTTEGGTEAKEIKLQCSVHKVLINPIGSNDPLDLSLVEERGWGFCTLHYLTLNEGYP